MIAHTTATLGAKLAKALNIKIKQVVLAPPSQILGKLKERGLKEKIPAMAIDRKGISINRENVIRSTASRKGFSLSDRPQEGELKVLHCLPVKVPYEVGVFTGDRDALDRAEGNLLWFLEEGSGNLDVQVEMSGIEFTLPIQMSPTLLTETFDIERDEEWEKAKVFRMNFNLEVTTFLLRSSLKPTILKIDYKLVQENDIVLVES
jgi:hypothetical protein